MEFVDGEGETIARTDVTVRLFPSGPTIVNEFVLNSDHQKHRISVRNASGGRRCQPNGAAAAGLGRHGGGESDDDDDEGEWDVVCAKLGNGQKIAVRYDKSYYGLLPAAAEDDDDDEDCRRCTDPRSDVMTRSEETLYGRVFELMREMHESIAESAAERRDDDDDGRTAAAGARTDRR